MATEKIGGYISKLQFNTGDTIDIKEDDIVVFVGPNNAGKSQSLKDIYALSSKKISPIVISDINIEKHKGAILHLLEKTSNGRDNGTTITYSILGNNINYFKNNSEATFTTEKYYGNFRDLFIANLDTAARLDICNPPSSITRNSSKVHPIHYAAFGNNYRKWLSDNFKKAFNIEVTPNTQYGAKIPLCMGQPVLLNGQYKDEQERLEEYATILGGYKQVQDQGDGIKSFTGILLYLMLDYYRTYLIDEPESFLHPPQARIMGQIIGGTLRIDQQAFISTHSEEIIKGLLVACPQRIKIVRITRVGDTNAFSILDNNKFEDIWNDPLLKYSNIMSSLFHKSVVLCESDSDCKMYSVVDDYIKQTNDKYSEVLFIHCGGKHRMAKIATSLRALEIDVKLIVDIDILNDEKIFKNIVEAYSINWSDICSDYKVIVSNINSPKEKVNRNDARTTINRILDNSQNVELSDREIKNIREVIKTISKWDRLKSSGRSALPSGDTTNAFNNIDKILHKHGIYIVPVGELEGFIREISGHGPDWVNKTLENYPDLSANEYKTIREFISEIVL